jgi:hypothetical protein
MSREESALSIRLGAFSFELPPSWDHEIDLVSRAPSSGDTYRPNLRITYRTTPEPVHAGALAKEYEARLSDAMSGATVELVRSSTRAIGEGEGIELTFRVKVAEEMIAHHQVLLAARQNQVLTIAANRRAEGEDPEAVAALARALVSVTS